MRSSFFLVLFVAGFVESCAATSNTKSQMFKRSISENNALRHLRVEDPTDEERMDNYNAMAAELAKLVDHSAVAIAANALKEATQRATAEGTQITVDRTELKKIFDKMLLGAFGEGVQVDPVLIDNMFERLVKSYERDPRWLASNPLPKNSEH